MPRPCAGLRVLDLSSGPSGGIATMVLADFGTDVIKVERPGGDPYRRMAAAPMWLRGKRSITLDLRNTADRERLHALAPGVDVVVASYRPGKAAALGADYQTLAALNRGLIYCSITGFGPRGPYAHYPPYEAIAAAKSGRMQAFAGQPRRDGPVFAAVPVGVHVTSQVAVAGVLAALLARERSGRGALVETSLLQAMLPYDLNGLLGVQLMRSGPDGSADFPPRPAMPTLNYHPVLTQDGRWIQLGNLLEHLFHAFIAAADLSDIYAEERFRGSPESWDDEAREAARDRILHRVRERTADDWMQTFHANGNVAAEPFATTQEALEHPDIVAGGNVSEVTHPRLGAVRQLGLLADLTETPGAVGGPDPAPGEHTAEVLSAPQRAPWRPPATPVALKPGQPLDGITILEFATIIATPLAASVLADLGARVIKVEPVNGGDPFRGRGTGAPPGTSSAKTTAGKESICIDLKRPDGRAIVERLIARAEAIVHNYRPGVPERLGIGYETAHALRPDIVYVAVNGYGPAAPSAHRPSAHPIPGAAVGGALYQAGSGLPPPECESLAEIREAARWLSRANEANPDPNTSMVVAAATLLGLYAQQRHGVGQRIFVNMLGANTYANADDFIAYAGKPPRTPVDPQLHGLHALYRLYRARSGWLFLAILTNREWDAFCETVPAIALGRDPRFAGSDARRRHDAELIAALEELFAARDADEWERVLTAEGVGCVRADASRPGEFWADDEHAHMNGFAPFAPHARFGNLRRWGPVVMVDGKTEGYGPGALAGEHTDRILSEVGYRPDEIDGLRAAGIVWSEDPEP